MRYLGLENLPTFDNPNPQGAIPQSGEIGYACQGKQIDSCRKFLEKYSGGRAVDDDMMRNTLCMPCKGAKK